MGSPKLPKGYLDVELIKGEDTKGTEFEGFGKADPYCIIKLADLKYSSKVCNDAGSKPVWNQTFTFSLKTSDVKYSELTFSLFNKNSRFRDDDSLGQARIDLASLVAKKGNNIPADRYPVFIAHKRTEKQFGWIHVGFNFTPDSSASKEDDGTGGETKSNAPEVNNTTSEGNAIPKEDNSVDGSSNAESGGGKSKSGEKEHQGSAAANSGTSKPEPTEEEHQDGVANSGTSKPEPTEEDHQDSVPKTGTTPELTKEDHQGNGASSGTSTPEPTEEDHQGGVATSATSTPEPPEEDHQGSVANSGTSTGKGPTMFDGLCSAASSILGASKDLGRKFSFKYVGVPSLVIACLLFAAGKRRGRDMHEVGEISESDAAALKNGMPTSTRQNILFHKIYDTD